MSKFIRNLLLLSIRAYQLVLSPDHSWLRLKYPHGYCRFYPTCSQFSYEALARDGVKKGILLTLSRLRRCHPWSQGGYDPLSHH